MEGLLSQKMNFFSQLISCGQELYYWELDPGLQLVETSCAENELVYSLFLLNQCAEQLKEYVLTACGNPLILADSMGLSWIAAFETASGQLSRIHMIGPAFTSDFSHQALEHELNTRNFPNATVRQFRLQIQALPVIPIASWMQYGLMLHFCISGEKIEVDDFNYPIETNYQKEPQIKSKNTAPGSGTWIAEQTAMQMIEEGQLDYQRAFGHLSMSANFTIPTDSAMQNVQQKNAVLSFITLSTRAAIRGGLDAETAYYIGNMYIENAENASTLSDLMQINSTMYADFVKRVHKIHTKSGISPNLLVCCNYIERHLNEKLTMKQLAEKAGYSEYYLSQKFKKELGMNVTQYISLKRIERAKMLLHSSNQSIQSISEELGFCNQSYFSEIFRSIVGMSPGEYREHR